MAAQNPVPEEVGNKVFTSTVKGIETFLPATDETPTEPEQEETHGIRFRHLRFQEWSDASKISPLGGIAIAYELVEVNKGKECPFVYQFALSRCHENDVYVKHTARQKSSGRLKGKGFVRKVEAASRKDLLKFFDLAGYMLDVKVNPVDARFADVMKKEYDFKVNILF